MPKQNSKVCTKCQTSKPLDEFYKSKTSKDGHVTWCRTCWKASIAAKVERRKAEAAAAAKPKRKRPAKKTT